MQKQNNRENLKIDAIATVCDLDFQSDLRALRNSAAAPWAFTARNVIDTRQNTQSLPEKIYMLLRVIFAHPK
jgi:hypothetical protein